MSAAVLFGVLMLSLPPCPDKPNCVSSMSAGKNSIAPIRYESTRREAHDRLVAVLRALPRTKIVSDDGTTLRVEFRSRLFRFVDDAIFLFDERSRTIHMRSAARTGYYDFGVNRGRIEQIRRDFEGR